MFDYIIVGAGAAGCVLADKLSADPANRVLVVEFGRRDTNPLIHIPKGFFFTLRGDRYAYHYKSQPIGPKGQIETWTRGKVIGGSTAINGMMYMRGAAADYDAIVARGNPGWGWEQVLSAFRAMEDHQLGASAARGAGGRYGVSIPVSHDPVNEAVVAAATQLGWNVVEDANASDDERIGFTPSSTSKGKRVSAATAFLRPALRRGNLTLVTGTKATQLMMAGDHIVGVRTRTRSGGADYRAAKEVVLSAGTIETTLLLERSGIGNPKILRRHEIDVKLESPNVGERVIEQRVVASQYTLRSQTGLTTRLNTIPKQGWEGLKYLLTRRGPISTPGYDLVCQFKTSPELARPDAQALWTPMALDVRAPEMTLANHAGFMFMGYQIRPDTEGSVHIGGASPSAPPIIDARFLESARDRAATGAILQRGREVVAQSPLADLVEAEEFPGPAVSTPDDVVRYAHDTGVGVYHAVGSAAMGPDDDDVVDSDLRVRGVSGLRVVDASVFRVHPAGNTAAATMAFAWLAADRILRDN